MGQPTAVQTPTETDTSPKSKAARMEEWSQLPLREWPDMERWLTVMSDRFTIEQPSEAVSDTSGQGYAIPITPTHDKQQTLRDQPHSELVSYAWPPRNNRVSSGSSYNAHQPHPDVFASPVYFGHQVAVEPEPVPSVDGCRDGITGEDAVDISNARAGEETGPSKAEELSYNNPSLYF
ncbi:hypothetical protein N7516_006338 [Penicillium verrucosum]|uniref:uncharacterized protein n=1 Tax=Penicillium verrucosum TaxID=60171 RepID=UPI002544DE16|nr:uncharacterized protein N7516_006338 [Penicillium verrucosum]KAJ5931849.1 hypothetical protein N7516_006338 [Penicillium verrucosum]